MTLCDYAENPKKREGTRKRSVRVAALHVKGDERRMKVKMEKVIDITKKCFYIYNSFVVYLQSNRHENCDVILSLSTLVHFSTPVLPLVTSCNKHSISLKRAGIYNRDSTECCCRFSKKKAKTFHQSNPFKAQPMGRMANRHTRRRLPSAYHLPHKRQFSRARVFRSLSLWRILAARSLNATEEIHLI